MSIRTPSSSEVPMVQVPQAEPRSGGWQSIPHVQQLQPRGAEQGYANGAYNCAPAVVAMLARGAGKKSELSDAQLITELGKGLVTQDGSTPQGLARMLARAELPIAGKALAGNYSDAAVQEHLEQGHKLIAQVALTGADTKDASAHYVLIRGVNAQGNYVISDPMSSGSSVVTPEQLRKAVHGAPPDGGLLLPVAGPRSSARTNTGSQLLASLLRTPKPAPTPPADSFEGSPSPQKPRTVAGAADLSQLDPSAFSVSAAAFNGVNTDFQQDASSGTRAPMSGSEWRNVVALNIDYGEQGKQRSLLSLLPVTPRGTSPAEFVQELRQRKQNQDPTVDALLERLESSLAPQDHLVMMLFEQQELRDPGIGKKTWVDPM
ncbi:C39 family peptidase [Hyalangium sp.]|uniref:C39 family peptidase n=1 Tax=Hyalangium sp. TaxID=2028555 RepID=UPI002D4EA927|nr:C39 family peptidase [Hyalangium sp.]HYH98645.1 C39 family peptidase [Hyalangium sp.]